MDIFTETQHALKRRQAVEIRRGGDGGKLHGLVAPYNSVANIGPYQERIAPGAFGKTLSSDAEVLAFADHDAAKLLGRRSTGTLRLTDRDDGLHFELSIPDTSIGRDIRTLAERGDLGGASIGFVIRENGERYDGNMRILTDIDLREISIIQSWPAYEQTTVEARARKQAQAASSMAMRRRWLTVL
ncbi:MAG: HK97 family phage prohead protease [Pseudomonadota bacterium]